MEDIFILIQKYFNGSCSVTDKLFVEDWIAKSDENKKLFEQLKEIWISSGQIVEKIELHPVQAWERIKLETGIQDSKNSTISIFRNKYGLLKIAATLLILIGLGTFVKYQIFNKSEFLTVSSYNESKKQVILPDSSVVFLNCNSQISYNENFIKNSREVILQGEAFFKVTKDKFHPFIVHTKGTNTRVLGTSFNINANDTAEIIISIYSGKVAFSQENSEVGATNLVKGESGVFSKKTNSITKQSTDNQNAIAWQTGVLKFEKATLGQVAVVLSGYYSKTIEVSPQIQDRLITVEFDNQSFRGALEILELTLELKAEYSDNKVILKPLEP